MLFYAVSIMFREALSFKVLNYSRNLYNVSYSAYLFILGWESMVASEIERTYWRTVLTITAIFTTIWFIITYVVHAIAPQLHTVIVNGAPLNWWMIQGSISIGIVLAFLYALIMNNYVDKKFYKNYKGER